MVSNFDLVKDATEKILVWIHFLRLPIEYYYYLFLMKIEERIGKPRKIDEATSLVSRWMFARICVKVDITKSLVARFKLRGVVRRI